MPDEPKTIGRYEIIHLLGRGAMGVVYLAFDPLLKRPLAIKTVRKSSDPEASLQRFQREAEISARLSHPNIVTIHDVGQDPQAGPFLAMEFIDGLPLGELIQEGIPTESAIHLLLQAMSALQAAERAGITHRDVKPSNILVSHEGRLKLMDFGIAREAGTRLTQTGQLMGTPSYTAPEALGGVQANSASDRYAFAVTAFQILTSELPFECATIAATLFRIAHEPPLFPERMGPTLRGVFEKALAKRPGDRYADLASFMGDLIAAVELPGETKAKLLDGLSGSSGAEVAQLIKSRAETTTTINRYLPTQANPALAEIEALGTLGPPTPGGPGQTVATVPHLGPARPPDSGRRRRWPWLAAAGLLAAAIVGAGVWWLQPRAFRLDIASTPAGARVTLGGRELGRTDLIQAQIPKGGGTLRLELEGYESREWPVRAGDGPIHLVLERPPFTVQVVTSPPGAQAWLNGVAHGTTPIRALQVPGEGRQELVLRLRERRDWTRVLARDAPLPGIIRLERLRPALARRRGPGRTVAGLPGTPAAPPTQAATVAAPGPARPVEPPVPERAPARQALTMTATPPSNEHRH